MSSRGERKVCQLVRIWSSFSFPVTLSITWLFSILGSATRLMCAHSSGVRMSCRMYDTGRQLSCSRYSPRACSFADISITDGAPPLIGLGSGCGARTACSAASASRAARRSAASVTLRSDAASSSSSSSPSS